MEIRAIDASADPDLRERIWRKLRDETTDDLGPIL